jgi:hypothetical protein
MKTTLLSILALFLALSSQAQLKLDVTGDSRITGRLDLQTASGGNLFLGFNTGQNNMGGSQNTFVGTKAGEGNETGTANTFLGAYAGVANINGHDNVFVGQGTGGQNISGRYNTFLGSFSGPFNTSGIENTIIGNAAGNLNTSGFRNTFVGRLAGSTNETGQYNTILGFNLPDDSENARIDIYNVDGKLLRTLPLLQSGEGKVQLNTDQFPEGIYVYSLVVNNKLVESKRMIVTK